MLRKWIPAFAVLLFGVGLCLFLYPYANALYDRVQNQSQIRQFTAELQSAPPPVETDADSTAVPQRPYAALYDAMQAYNDTLYQTNQGRLTDEDACAAAPFDLSEYGLADDMIGYLSIPALELELALYLGANDKHLADGAAVLGQTSMPLGGENTNCVIAGHRGWKGTAKFRDLPTLEFGDEVVLTTPWDELHYVVIEKKIIEPSSVSEILIRPGRDLLSFVTCHPYRQHSQRYLVVCERVTQTNP